MDFYPLQVTYIKSSDPVAAVILFAIIGVVIVILVVVNIAKNGINIGSGFGGGLGGGGPVRFSRWALRRAVAPCGLDAKQMALLESVFRLSGISDPVKALENPTLLDRIFKRAFRLIESNATNEADAEAKKAQLFFVRNAVGSVGGSSSHLTSTRQLTEGLVATILDLEGQKYPVKIVSVRGERLIVEMPKNSNGDAVRVARGAKLSFSVHDRSRQGYRFETRVAALTATSLELAHADRLTVLPSRRFQRKEINLSCYFSTVRIETQTVGRKTVRKTIADDKRTIGNIMDLSAGGCAVKTAASLNAGEYLKLEFDDGRNRTVAALGRVVRTNKTGSIGGIMHIQFAKVPQRTFNVINAIVYGFDQD